MFLSPLFKNANKMFGLLLRSKVLTNFMLTLWDPVEKSNYSLVHLPAE